MQSTTRLAPNKTATNTATNTATTGLYDLWLNSMLPTVGTSMVTAVTSSASHQIRDQQPKIRRNSRKAAAVGAR